MAALFLKVFLAFFVSFVILCFMIYLIYFLLLKRGCSVMSRSAGFWSSVSSIVAILALVFGSHQFNVSSEAQKESAAVSLYYEYTKLMLEYGGRKNSSESHLGSLGSAILVAGESIFLMRKDKSGWVETVRLMISQHADIFIGNKWNCATLDDKFYELISESISCSEG